VGSWTMGVDGFAGDSCESGAATGETSGMTEASCGERVSSVRVF
jgi:hypothetical protein